MTTYVPPEPHSLDYDWRFDQQTLEFICEQIGSADNIVAIGTPTLARQLNGTRSTLLIDRQPSQGVNNQLVLDVNEVSPVESSSSVAIMDPPWYPEDLMRWLTWAGHVIGPEGIIYTSLWPDSTRPSAPLERADVFAHLSHWAKLHLFPNAAGYTVPAFESEARAAQGPGSPLRGDLLKVEITGRPDLVPSPRMSRTWTRYLLNNYQLAVATTPCGLAKAETIEQLPRAQQWTWPFVSRRAGGRENIDLWSSHNEVGRVVDTAILSCLLDALVEQNSTIAYMGLVERFPELRQWAFPKAPYERLIRWTHRS